MTREEKQMLNEGVPHPDENLESKAAVTCFLLFFAAFVMLAIVLGAIEIVKSIF